MYVGKNQMNDNISETFFATTLKMNTTDYTSVIQNQVKSAKPRGTVFFTDLMIDEF